MNVADAHFQCADAKLFDVFATPCSIARGIVPGFGGRCIVDDGVAKIGQYGQVIGRVTKVSFIKSEWDPARGDVVTIDGVARKVEALDTDDGRIVGVVLHG